MEHTPARKYATGGIIGLGEYWTPGNIYDPTPAAAKPTIQPSPTFSRATTGTQQFDVLNPGDSGSPDGSGETGPASTSDIGPASSTVGDLLGAAAGIATGFATGNPGYAGAARGGVSGLAQGKSGWDLATDIAKGYAFSAVPALGLAYSGYKGLNALSDFAGWSGPNSGIIGTTESMESVGRTGYQNGILGAAGLGPISFDNATVTAAKGQMDAQAAENDANRGYGSPSGSGGFTGGYDNTPTETSYSDMSYGGGGYGGADGDGSGGGGTGSNGGAGGAGTGGEDGGSSDGNGWATGGMIGTRPNPPANLPPTLDKLRAAQNPQAQATNPAQQQQMQVAIQKAMVSGKVTPQLLHMGEQMCVAVLQNPELYPNLRNFAIQRGLVKPNSLPPQFDQRVVLAILSAVRQMAGAAPQGVVPPQGMPQGNGGQLFGPGTGTSDEIPARNMADGGEVKLSNGEYIIPERVVRAKGKDFFDALVRKYAEVP